MRTNGTDKTSITSGSIGLQMWSYIRTKVIGVTVKSKTMLCMMCKTNPVLSIVAFIPN